MVRKFLTGCVLLLLLSGRSLGGDNQEIVPREGLILRIPREVSRSMLAIDPVESMLLSKRDFAPAADSRIRAGKDTLIWERVWGVRSVIHSLP